MSENKSKQGIVITRGKLAVIILIILALIAAGIFVGINWNNWFGEKEPISTVGTPDIDPNAGDYSGQQPTDQGGESTGIKIPGYPSITVAANTTDVTMALLNPEGNPCYFTFQIVLDDTGETIYQSKMVPPGKSISKVTLTKALTPGEHKATIKITTASLEDLSAMNGANVETVLIAK